MPTFARGRDQDEERVDGRQLEALEEPGSDELLDGKVVETLRELHDDETDSVDEGDDPTEGDGP